MRYFELKDKLKHFTVISLSDIRKIDPKFYQPRLSEWQNKGYIKRLRNGYYIFADTPMNEERLFLVANKLHSPSYVSFEMALSHYNLIPEGVFSVTSATSKKTERITTPIGYFIYRSLKPELLFGYEIHKTDTQPYKFAEIEKAVLDYLYIHPTSADLADLEEWRFNSQEFLEQADLVKFNRYVKAFNSPALERRAKKFLKFIQTQET